MAGAALLIRLLYFLIVRHGSLVEPDSQEYLSLARHLGSSGHFVAPGLSSAGFPADLNRTPGYPAFLVAANLGGHIGLERSALVQSVLAALFVGALTYGLGRTLGLRVGTVAGALLAIDFMTVINTPLILSDVPFAIFYSGGILLSAFGLASRRTAWAVAGGVILGLATLIKPIGLVAGVALVIVWLVRPRAHSRGLAALLAMVVVVLPWVVRNESRYGVLSVSSISALNLYVYNAFGVQHDGYVFSGDTGPGGNVANRLTAGLRAQHPTVSRLYSRMNSDALGTITSHLPKAVVQELWGTGLVTIGTGKQTLLRSTASSRLSPVITTLLPLAQVVLVWVLAALGALVAWRRRLFARSGLGLVVLGVLFALLAAGGPAGYGRYRLPVVPLQCTLAAIGIWALMGWWHARRSEPAAPVSPGAARSPVAS